MLKKYIFIPAIVSIFFIGCKNDTVEETNNINAPVTNNNTQVPVNIPYNITNVYPHDSTSFTEGLEWKDGFLYESGGDWGLGKLAKVEISTGKDVQRKNFNSKEEFKEGITIFNNKIYQLNYKTQVCEIFDLANFQSLKTLPYDGEGWGMTNNGKYLIMNNGSDKLYFRDPETFKVMSIVSVKDNNGPLAGINEMEWVNGFIYANVFMTDKIVKINPETGWVVGEADFSGILQKHGIMGFSRETEQRGPVLNGIAYDTNKKVFYITGKLWPKLFEVSME